GQAISSRLVTAGCRKWGGGDSLGKPHVYPPPPKSHRPGVRRHVACEGRAMHPVTFVHKRLHWQSVAFGKKVVEDVEDMTPARFDLLYLVRTKRYVWMTVTQESLWKRLGVDPSTVSKMLKRLLELWWIQKEQPLEGNRRTRSVWLTELGMRKIDEAMRLVFEKRSHRNWFEAFFKRARSAFPVLQAIGDFLREERWMAMELKDRSRLIYSYGNDE